MAAKAKGRFIDPMLLLRTDSLPNDGGRWEYQLKFDGYRAIAFKTGGKIHLRSRNDNDFSIRYSDVVKGLAKLPDETVIDGEVIALDDDGRPSFNILQNYGSSKAPVLYFVFDVMVLAGRDVMREPLEMRRELLEKKILPKLGEPVRYAAPLDASLPVLIESVKAQGLEGLVAKRLDSRYEAGLRSGAWQKMRVNRGQEFVIGGYTVGTKTFDALVFGYYEGDRLIYAARTRNGFTPVVREQLFKKFRGLEIKDCPFVNLPEAKSGRWGAAWQRQSRKTRRVGWKHGAGRAKPRFLEWTGENHLRHAKFVALRDDKPALRGQTRVASRSGDPSGSRYRQSAPAYRARRTWAVALLTRAPHRIAHGRSVIIQCLIDPVTADSRSGPNHNGRTHEVVSAKPNAEHRPTTERLTRRRSYEPTRCAGVTAERPSSSPLLPLEIRSSRIGFRLHRERSLLDGGELRCAQGAEGVCPAMQSIASITESAV